MQQLLLQQPPNQKLVEFNKKLYYELSKPGKIFFPGLFFGQRILFIGQNPGRPHLVSQDFEIHERIFQDYNQFLDRHNESYYQSKFFKFLIKFASIEFKLKLEEFSFTNLIKYSVENNQIKNMYNLETCLQLLEVQIKLLKPKRIVVFGRVVSTALEFKKIPHIAYFHPSYFNYTKTERFKDGIN